SLARAIGGLAVIVTFAVLGQLAGSAPAARKTATASATVSVSGPNLLYTAAPGQANSVTISRAIGQTTLSSGGSFVGPIGIVLAANGDLFVADDKAGVIRVDPVSWAPTPVSAGGVF